MISIRARQEPYRLRFTPLPRTQPGEVFLEFGNGAGEGDFFVFGAGANFCNGEDCNRRVEHRKGDQNNWLGTWRHKENDGGGNCKKSQAAEKDGGAGPNERLNEPAFFLGEFDGQQLDAVLYGCQRSIAEPA